MNYLKIRGVKPRFLGEPWTYEVKIVGRRSPGVWDTLGTSRGHPAVEAARIAGRKLAGRRGIKLEDDVNGKALRTVEFEDRYGDIDTVSPTKPKIGRPRRAKSTANERITIRLTVAERAKYEAAAAKQGLALGDWAREAFELALVRGATR